MRTLWQKTTGHRSQNSVFGPLAEPLGIPDGGCPAVLWNPGEDTSCSARTCVWPRCGVPLPRAVGRWEAGLLRWAHWHLFTRVPILTHFQRWISPERQQGMLEKPQSSWPHRSQTYCWTSVKALVSSVVQWKVNMSSWGQETYKHQAEH